MKGEDKNKCIVETYNEIFNEHLSAEDILR